MDLTDRRVWIALWVTVAVLIIGVAVSVLAFAECRAAGMSGFLCLVLASG